nr:hypothetical protein BaRGS_007605 [Batillaria attramentaria]
MLGCRGPEVPGFSIVYLIRQSDNIACDDPGTPLHGSKAPGGNYSLGSVVQFQCDAGYRLDGSSSVTCIIGSQGASGFGPKWSAPIPQCLSSCPTPPTISHGSFHKDTDSLEVNATVTYSCDEPYLTQNATQLTCVVSDAGAPAWNSPPPTCRIPDCHTWKDIRLNRPSWVLVHPSYPQDVVLGGSRLCHWTITVAAGKAINFNVSYIDIPRDAIFKLTDQTTQTDLLSVSGVAEARYQFPLNVTSAGSTVVAVYVGIGQNSTGKRGFYVSYKTVDSSSQPVFFSSTTQKPSLRTTPITFNTDHPGPSSEKVPPESSDEGDDSTAVKIAVGVIVPLVVLALIVIGVVYWMYRKKYPVRMILGRDFGKFSNPSYRAPSKPHTLVRDDAEEFFQQTQPGGPGGHPNISLIISGDGRESSAQYQNVAFVFDSGDADEEEVERRFRERKAYLFKKAEDSADGGNTRDDKAALVKGSKDSGDTADGGEDERGRDNAGFVSDVDETDGDATRRSKTKTGGRSASNTDVEETSDSSEGENGDEYTVPVPAEDRRRPPPSPPSSEEGSATTPQKEEVEYHAGMTVKQFLEMVKSREKRALSDTPRERAGSFNRYDQSMSARRRSQSVDTALEPTHLMRLTDRFKANVSVLRTSSDAGRYDKTSLLRVNQTVADADGEPKLMPEQGKTEEAEQNKDNDQPADDGRLQSRVSDEEAIPGAKEHHRDEETVETTSEAGADENDNDSDRNSADAGSLSDQDSSSDSELELQTQHAGRGRGKGSLSNLLTDSNSSPVGHSDSDVAVPAPPGDAMPENAVANGEGASADGDAEIIYDDIYPGDERNKETPSLRVPDGSQTCGNETDVEDRENDEKALSSENSDSSSDKEGGQNADFIREKSLSSGEARGNDNLESGDRPSATGEKADVAGTPDRQISTDEEGVVVLSRNGHRVDWSDSASSSSDSVPQDSPAIAVDQPADPAQCGRAGEHDFDAAREDTNAEDRPGAAAAQVASAHEEGSDRYSIKTNSSFSSIRSGDAENVSLSADEMTFSNPLSEVGNQEDGVRSAPRNISPPFDGDSESDSEESTTGLYANWSPADAERESAPKVQVVPGVTFSDISSESASPAASDPDSDDDGDGKLRYTNTPKPSSGDNPSPPPLHFDTEVRRESPSRFRDSDGAQMPTPLQFLPPAFSKTTSTGADETQQASRPKGLAALGKLSASLSNPDDSGSDDDLELTEEDIEAALSSTDSSEEENEGSLTFGAAGALTVKPSPVTVSADPATTFVFSEENESDIDV